MSNKDEKTPQDNGVPPQPPSDEDDWEDEDPEDEEEGIIIEDGMELEFDEDGNIVGAGPAVENSANDRSVTDTKPAERPPYVVASYHHHMEEVVSLAINPVNLNEFATGGMDDQLVFWEFGGATPSKFFKFDETVAFVEYGFDGKIFVAATLDSKLRIFEHQEGSWTPKSELKSTSEEITVG